MVIIIKNTDNDNKANEKTFGDHRFPQEQYENSSHKSCDNYFTCN